MKLFTTCLAIAIIFCNTAFAGSGNPSNVSFPQTFSTELKEKKSLYETATAKVCACQVLRVASNNQKETLIAVFAQGTNNVNTSSDIASANTVLEKEKKHLKEQFYTKVKTTETVTATTECSILYKSIQIKYENIKLYDVMDADALANRLVVKK